MSCKCVRTFVSRSLENNIPLAPIIRNMKNSYQVKPFHKLTCVLPSQNPPMTGFLLMRPMSLLCIDEFKDDKENCCSNQVSFLQIIVPFSLAVPWGLVNDGLKTIESFRMAYRVCGQKVNARYIM